MDGDFDETQLLIFSILQPSSFAERKKYLAKLYNLTVFHVRTLGV
jgi:hypothetical protein